MPDPLHALLQARSIGPQPGTATTLPVDQEVDMLSPSMWKMGSVRPKPDGALFEVLQRAALKNGTGVSNTPGEMDLLRRFDPVKMASDSLAGKIGPKPTPPTQAVEAPSGGIGADLGDLLFDEQRPKFKPWSGLHNIMEKLGIW